MSSQSLLNKERDFLELNAELEAKVKSLMSEVDTIISKQENVMRPPKESSCNILFRRNNKNIKKAQHYTESDSEEINFTDLCSDNTSIKKQSSKETKYSETTEDEYDYDNDEDDEKMKKKKKRSTNETIIRFLKAQVVKLQTDLQTSQLETKKKNERCKELEAEIKKNEERIEKLYNQISGHKETLIKADVSNSELNLKIQTQSSEITSLKKEMENLKKDLKSLNQLSSNSDIRLNRSLEENEKLRLSLKTSQAEEKELRDQIRKIQEEKRIALKNSEKQRADIFQAFKKQTQLVDNLKKQKAYLEASKEIQFIEDDFTKLLEWKPDKVCK